MKASWLTLLVVCMFPCLLLRLDAFPYLLKSRLEICENGKDDDGDGLADLLDPDCTCQLIEPLSLIPNPSFEEMNCCPNNRSQLDCAAVWIQASEATTDYLHICGWMGWPEFPPPVPFPDGEGVMGFRDGRVRQGNVPEPGWKEYAGACLTSPLLAGNSYRFEFYVGFVNALRSPPIDITFFGTPECKFLPFGQGNDFFGCPTNGPGWIELGASYLDGGTGNKWLKTAIEITPDVDIKAIAIGPACPDVLASVSIYYFFDDLVLADIRAFELQIKEINHPCSNQFRLGIPDIPGYAYQWFRNGLGLPGEDHFMLKKIYGEGNYQVRITDGFTCRLSASFEYKIPVLRTPALQIICKDDSYRFGKKLLHEPGIYVDTFQSVNECDSIVQLQLKVLGELSDTTQGRIFPGETFELEGFEFKEAGDFVLPLVSSIGCDSLVLLRLDYYQVYFPNIFSPNGDGINELFYISGEPGSILASEIYIFDNWGNTLAHGKEWDGKENGRDMNPGVYTYLVKLRMSDGAERIFKGTVTLIR